MKLMENASAMAEKEREQLASGRKPAPRFQNKVQRAAVKLLAVFFVLVLVFTLLSRAAVGIAVARVDVKKPMTGILTQRTTVSGNLSALGDLEITLPGGIRVNKISASVGQRVEAGDVLMEFDMEGLNSAIEKLKSDLALLDLKIAGAAKGNSQSAMDSVLNAQAALKTAQEALEDAQEDYDRLTTGRATAETRSAEDLAQAQADYDEAVTALTKAKTKAKEELIKTTQEKLDTARENLTTTQESAKEAVEGAKSALESAQDQESNADSAYYDARNTYENAKDAVTRAQEAYDAAVGTEGEAEALAALNQAKAARDQAENGLNSLATASDIAARAVKRAKESLKTAEEKRDAKVKKAEADVSEAENKLTEAKNKTDLSEESLVISAQSALDSAESALKSARRGSDDTVTATGDQLLAAQRTVESARRGVESAQRTLDQANAAAADERVSNQSARQQAEVERLGYVNDRRDAQKKLDSLSQAAENGGALVAPAAGTVLTIMEETGLTTEGAKVASISRSDQGFEFKGKVSQEDAEQLAVGDAGNLSFTVDGKSHELQAKVTAIGMADDKGMVEIAVSLPEGNYPTGSAAKFEISKRSEQYGTVLPLGALRNDGESYVLVLREKQTVMGIEQTVEKMPVTVDAQDSESMAVSGSLPYDAQVIVGANKPIEEGDRVRVNEDS